MVPIAPPGAREAPHVFRVAAAAADAPRMGAGAAESGAGASAGAAAPNPALRLDPELGLVVLEFRDRQGEVAASLPTPRELDAYRRAVRAGAPKPVG